MPLPNGTRIGHYEILVPVGEGGMGEVYRARDTKLKRDVALKVLPAAFVGDPERMARFQREAEVLASLNHPNIAAIYGVEHDENTHALAMEFVEGASPAPSNKAPMPFDEAWNIAAQIADALEYAHDKGIIHRDLKPANVKVTPDGAVKLLDFGLAKAFTARAVSDSGPGSGNGAPAAENSPTLTMGATEAGMILGTAAYMSPEQAKGKNVDKRADIWAFGVVLYELLSGTRPFHGDDVGDVLASVIKDQPALDKVPAQARPLIESCLEKDPKKRLRDIGDAHCLLNRDSHGAGAASADLSAPLWSRFHLIPWGVAALLLITAVALGFVHFRETPPAEESLRFRIATPGDAPARFLALSPDGRNLAFVANNGGASQIWIRPMDALEPRSLAGTTGATYLFWSPDSTYLGFFADGKLKKIAVGGGPAQTLCEAADGRGGSWNRDGVIVFSAGPTNPISRVGAAGGTPVAVTKLPEGNAGAGHRFPVFLPDGVHFLFNSGNDRADLSGVFVASLDGSAPLRILPDLTNALYAPPDAKGSTGHLLFRREITLMAQPFNAAALKLTGDAFPIAEQVPANGMNTGFGAFSVAASGTLIFRNGDAGTNRELVWMDRTGKRLGTVGRPGDFGNALALSPDEKTAAVSIQTGGQIDIWLEDLLRGVASRFTFRPGVNRNPVWSPDGSRIVFALQFENAYASDLYQKPSAGNGQEDLLVHSGVNGYPFDWSSDGKWIVYQVTGKTTGTDLWLLPMQGDHKPIPYLQTPFSETNAEFSPDAKWIAYQSNESGRNQIYIQAVPPNGAKYQISANGGTNPHWRRDGKELYYVSADYKLIAVPIKLGSTVEPGAPQALFTTPPSLNGVNIFFVPAHDGQRFLFNTPADGAVVASAPQVTVVTHWQAALKK